MVPPYARQLLPVVKALLLTYLYCFIWDILLKNVISGQSESETDTCRDGVIADILDILGEKSGVLAT